MKYSNIDFFVGLQFQLPDGLFEFTSINEEEEYGAIYNTTRKEKGNSEYYFRYLIKEIKEGRATIVNPKPETYEVF